MSSPGERPYKDNDLNVNKAALVKMVQRQQARWSKGKFSSSKVTVSQLKEALLDPENGFTTNKPVETSPPPPKTSNRELVPKAPSRIHSETPGEYFLHDHRLISLRKLTQGQDPPTPLPSPDAEIHIIRIFIEDFRTSPTNKTVARLSLPVLDRSDCAPGGFRVLSKELVSALQKSNAFIEISPDSSGVRMSIPDSEEEGWKIPFVCMQHGQFVDEMSFDPVALEVSEKNSIKLFIDNVGISIKAESTAPIIPPVEPSTSGQNNNSDIGVTEQQDPAVQFLREKLATRDGYQSFAGHRGRTIANPDIVKDWRFAVEFKRDFNKIRTPLKIKLQHIQTALGIHSTWLSNAQTAIDIIGTYGQVTEVSETLQRVDNPPAGAIVLFNFLVDWRKSHPL
ncbi:hypothetical protein B0H13DRAFT_2337600 [Mycena leptocephala]|nr:hypothetical protein B0H13DRAFT_2337600 [Mycena leptocephala]